MKKRVDAKIKRLEEKMTELRKVFGFAKRVKSQVWMKKYIKEYLMGRKLGLHRGAPDWPFWIEGG